jgi:predicted glycogen debranching enzyme
MRKRMKKIVRKITWDSEESATTEKMLTREWLVTNGLGGYASGTVGGVPTRRYHALLVAALPAPFGRRVMLNHLSENVIFTDGRSVSLGSEERVNYGLDIPVVDYLKEFRLENGIPHWRFRINDVIIERSIILPYRQNSVHISYKLLEGEGPIRIELRPSIHFRPHESPVSEETHEYTLIIVKNQFEISTRSELPPLRLIFYGDKTAFTSEGDHRREIFYRTEDSRGYDSRGLLWTPGYFRAMLAPGKNATLVASTEQWESVLALKPDLAFELEWQRREELLNNAEKYIANDTMAELVLAADQYIITPAGRIEDAVRIYAAGQKLRSVIAGYHWFTDWGRDTMISLEGLTLSTGREREAHWILKSFAHYIKDGLIPNLFPEGEKVGLYHTADATLWFFHAIERYLLYTDDNSMIKHLLPVLKDIIKFHIKGTRFGIFVDPEDGLLRQGAEGYQLTWMDAKVEDWVVTPRRGKAVEINALWYNALRLMENWVSREDGNEEAAEYKKHADKAFNSFNKKFWYNEGNYLFDVIEGEEGNDTACRPNQIFSISLDHPILEKEKWETILKRVEKELLTPVGLRSLAPEHPDYKPMYFGDLRSRDAAYHQGTVWGWLIGPFIDAWLKVYPDAHEDALKFLEGFTSHLNEACIGSISEVFDAEKPFTPRGCIAQAWSVAEVLRCYTKITFLQNGIALAENGRYEKKGSR